MRGRHAQETLGPSLGFKCPQCGAASAGKIEDGCPSCGSGTQKASHVGVDVIRNAEGGVTHAVPTDRLRDRRPDQHLLDNTRSVDDLFLAWFRPFRGKYDAAVETLIYEAYKAGYQVAGVTQGQSPLTGTPESRTLVAALRYFSENVLASHPEEVQTGEWLTVEAVEALITQLESERQQA